MIACRPHLGTYVEIRISAADTSIANAAMDAGFAAISRVERLMSAFRADSDLAKINQLAHREAVDVDAWTADLLRLAADLHLRSDGLFDCGIGNRLATWGMLPATKSHGHNGSLSDLYFCRERQVRSTKPLHLDLGGIAKGFAVDRASEAIRASGVDGATVNAGGDLRVIGTHKEAVYVRHPESTQHLHLAGHLEDGACATSATYYSRRPSRGREISALIRPRTGEPLLTRRSYSVIAPNCALADALTKVLALSEDCQHPCFRHYQAHPIIF